MAREQDLLPCSYYHLVFTLPDTLNALAISHPQIMYRILFEATWATLSQFGKTEGLQLGMIAILHTWGQNLSLHLHLHCIVPGGGIDNKGNWKRKIKTEKYLFCVKALSKVFRAKYVALLRKEKLADAQFLQSLFEKNWVVYAKAPFGGPQQIIEYLGRYTHKVAISTHRIKAITDDSITFSYKDYRDGNKQKLMTLSHEAFLRRFEQHILPKGFVKIRHSGFLSHQHKGERLKKICEQLHIAAPAKKVALPVAILAAIKYGIDIKKCSVCQDGRMELIATYVNIASQGVNLVQVEQFRPRSRASPLKQMIGK